MAQIITRPALPASSSPFYCPSSPDPTPLRLLAFSVAEAALQPDPNSPSFTSAMGKMPTHLEMDDWVAPSERTAEPMSAWAAVGPWSGKKEVVDAASQRRRPLWDIVAHAKDRRDKSKSSPTSSESTLPQSPPTSPGSYNFVLPSNSPLAASIAVGASPDNVNKSSFPMNNRRFPLFTRSAEPSPTKSTFSALDQTRPPPEFVPRLSAADFSAKAKESSTAAKHGRTKSDIASPASNSAEISSTDKLRAQSNLPAVPSRHTMRLPSLAQIQAKMTDAHRRGNSLGATPSSSTSPIKPRAQVQVQTQAQTQPRPVPKIRTVYRTDSSESVEVIKTPTDESPRRNPRIVLASILNRRPSTPPSPPLTTVKDKEPRLAPFLRERTSGRMSGGRARPMSMPPMSLGDLPSFEAIVKANAAASGPAFEITPPKERASSVFGNVPSPTKGSFPWTMNASGMCTPTEGRFNLSVSATPPRMTTPSPRRSFTSPASPTESVRSTGTSSPSLSVPMITCTPAPQTVLRDGIETESDEEEGDVVLFEGDSMSVDADSEADDEESKEREEREKRAEAMKKRLLLRRRSD
ncbi:hypothetical protein I316_07933 [Kwoniella heveanensis BCC8398]|uniref:Uncharacterized protein n=1 Tax=Kwoniella heveanensis BCC8398 TaxID=1296120 RepID=A0A1B9GHG8_9TREE|nr:hypothetical protein I316_07933 [Kwoniella heveanensis BCC8398]